MGSRAALVLALLGLITLLGSAPAQAAPRFVEEKLPVERKRAFDLGVVDYDRDGILDLFTTNHMFRDSLLRGTGSGFEDVYREAGFSPNPLLPGIEEMQRTPELREPGLYLFMKAGKKRPHIRISTHRLREIPEVEGGSANGRIVVVFPKVVVRRATNAEVEVSEEGERRTVISFDARANARIVLRPHHVDLPFRAIIPRPLPLESIFVGAEAAPAPDRRFTVSLGDRHGVAWADFNGDRATDAFVTGGGLAGRIRELRRARSDELLLAGPDGLRDAIEGSGIRKGTCRGREAASFDFDHDGVLDLLAGCRQGRPRLYRGLGEGRFEERRRALRARGPRATINRVVDLDNDGRPELVQAGKFFARVWRFGAGGKERLRQTVVTRNDDKNAEALAPADFDDDGDIDLFLAAPSGNTLLVNRGGRLRARDPATIGLPKSKGVAASWVDYDNDRDLDLHTAPDGLIINRGGRFRASGELAVERGSRFSRTSWFDADGDGRRDLAQLTQRGRGLFPQSQLLRNRSRPLNHWLAFDLIGSESNRQAVGARVRLRAGRRTLTQWVGQNDGSRYGQGHYRLYFGLGRQRRARAVTVFWPDGSRSRLGSLDADRLRVISRPG